MMVPASAPGAAMAAGLEPWLARQFAANTPYDEFARKLLLVSSPQTMPGVVPQPPPPAGDQSSKWVPYIYRTETVSGTSFPRPNGSTALQAYRESNGTLVNHGDGTYTYTLATNISNVTAGGQPVTYERNRKHRVAVMIGGHSGATATATFDFVPDGSTVALDASTGQERWRIVGPPSFPGFAGDQVLLVRTVGGH